jgi:hypothetical protein
MVEITIMIEGGVLKHENNDVATLENTESLRQSFHRIFSELSDHEVKISIQPLAGYKNAARKFSESSTDSFCLYVDLDDKKENIAKWFNEKINPIVISEDRKDRVFFMIQEMEAWILKQPDILDIWSAKKCYLRTNKTEKIVEHSLIAQKNIEEISKPSKTLYDIIKHFFSKENGGKKIQYGKLKDAPYLLDCLDVEKLKSNDSEINRFYRYIQGRYKHL